MVAVRGSLSRELTTESCVGRSTTRRAPEHFRRSVDGSFPPRKSKLSGTPSWQRVAQRLCASSVCMAMSRAIRGCILSQNDSRQRKTRMPLQRHPRVRGAPPDTIHSIKSHGAKRSVTGRLLPRGPSLLQLRLSQRGQTGWRMPPACSGSPGRQLESKSRKHSRRPRFDDTRISEGLIERCGKRSKLEMSC